MTRAATAHPHRPATARRDLRRPRPRRIRTPRWGLTALALLVGGLCAGGCTLGGIVDQAINGPTPTPAVFVLPDRVTAVLVDDPDRTLIDPRVPRTIGAVALHHMRFHGAPATAALVGADQVARLEARLGDAWHATPIDDIGRRLQSEQIVYARLTPIGLDTHRGDEGGVPSLRLDVKIIDTATGARVWPPEAVAAPDGYAVVVRATIAQRRARLAGKETPRQTLDHLTDAAGLALGQLFYDWTPPPPGRELDR